MCISNDFHSGSWEVDRSLLPKFASQMRNRAKRTCAMRVLPDINNKELRMRAWERQNE